MRSARSDSQELSIRHHRECGRAYRDINYRHRDGNNLTRGDTGCKYTAALHSYTIASARFMHPAVYTISRAYRYENTGHGYRHSCPFDDDWYIAALYTRATDYCPAAATTANDRYATHGRGRQQPRECL